jgi:hypothetical protein
LALQREAEWFGDGGRQNAGEREASISGIWEDDQGYLWVMIQVRDPSYAANLARLPEMAGGMGRGILPRDFSDLEDTVLDVIDPSEGRLIASRRFDEYMTRGQSVAAPILVYRERQSGAPRFDAMRPVLIRPPQNH